MSKIIGQSLPRKEDRRFLTGAGQYTADLSYPGQLELFIVRASTAHGHIRRIDTVAAAAAPGVHAVLTADDLDAGGVKDMQPAWTIFNPDGSPMHAAPREALARERIRYVGQPVVGIVADSILQAKDAAELVEFELDELPAIADIEAAIADGATLVWDHMPSNRCYEWAIGDTEAVEKAFAQAPHIVKSDITQNRLIPNAIEPRAVVAIYDAALDEYTLHVAHQNPHLLRTWTCAQALPMNESKLRVISADVGGGFGSKIYQYGEDLVALHAAKALGVPVKWVAERSEAFVSDAHARDHVTHAELAMDSEGTFLAMKVSTDANLGAALSNYGAAIPTVFYATMLGGVYKIAAIAVTVRGVMTNTVPTDAYRGAGRPEASYVIERLVDMAANAIGMDRLDIRRRNFIPLDAFPYESPLGLVYESAEYNACVDLAIENSDLAGYAARKADSEANGKLRGMGVIVYTEQAGAAPSQAAIAFGADHAWFEVATVRVNPDGSVMVLTGAHSHGQGHETTFAQVLAEQLGIPLEDIEIVHGDTGKIPYGIGTYASRSMSAGGSAVLLSGEKIITKGKKIAAHMLEGSPQDIDFTDGFFKLGDTDRIVAFKDVAREAYRPENYPLETLEPGLEETTFFDPPNFTFPAGCHVCEVEIDPETGLAEVDRYTVCDDFGVVVNPMVVRGQVHGGLAQGIGQALMENAVYDRDTAQPLTTSYLNYAMPRARDLPNFKVAEVDSRATSNPLGAKGCGEAGTIGAPIAVMNALLDALRPYGIEDLQMPATSKQIWSALQAAKPRS